MARFNFYLAIALNTPEALEDTLSRQATESRRKFL